MRHVLLTDDTKKVATLVNELFDAISRLEKRTQEIQEQCDIIESNPQQFWKADEVGAKNNKNNFDRF